mmetsp:Transcript_12043/g.34860  ORF Transcript_12043/g.34860 Transcript_12043/m.34860 type:complete len:871 (+) Transcript_12043:1-2613(+)
MSMGKIDYDPTTSSPSSSSTAPPEGASSSAVPSSALTMIGRGTKTKTMAMTAATTAVLDADCSDAIMSMPAAQRMEDRGSAPDDDDDDATRMKTKDHGVVGSSPSSPLVPTKQQSSVSNDINSTSTATMIPKRRRMLPQEEPTSHRPPPPPPSSSILQHHWHHVSASSAAGGGAAPFVTKTQHAVLDHSYNNNNPAGALPLRNRTKDQHAIIKDVSTDATAQGRRQKVMEEAEQHRSDNNDHGNDNDDALADERIPFFSTRRPSSQQYQSKLRLAAQSSSCCFNTDKLVAEELSNLPHAELVRVLEEVHGVPSSIIEETDDFVARKISEMKAHVQKIRNKSAYDNAHFLHRRYVDNDAFLLKFGGKVEHHPVCRLADIEGFTTQKFELFGWDRLTRDIQYSSTNDDDDDHDKGILSSGGVQILPRKDRSGRAVLCVLLGLVKNANMATRTSMLRSMWYIIMELIDRDEEVQRRGIVSIVYAVEDDGAATTNDGGSGSGSGSGGGGGGVGGDSAAASRHDSRLQSSNRGGGSSRRKPNEENADHDRGLQSLHDTGFKRKIKDIIASLPFRHAAVHFCYNDAATQLSTMSMLQLSIGTIGRVRFRAHRGDAKRCHAELLTFGIDISPLFMATDHHLEEAREGSSSSGGGGREAATTSIGESLGSSSRPSSLTSQFSRMNIYSNSNISRLQAMIRRWLRNRPEDDHGGGDGRNSNAALADTDDAKGNGNHQKDRRRLYPLEVDILFGKGRKYQEFPGNVRLQRLVEQNYPAYHKLSTKLQKTEHLNVLVKELQAQGTRFLKRKDAAGNGKDLANSSTWVGKNGNGDHDAAENSGNHAAHPQSDWEEVSVEVAREKVGTSFRNYRKQLQAGTKS